jgi:hypothetical protein
VARKLKNIIFVYLSSVFGISTVTALAVLNLSGTFLEVKDLHDLFEMFGALATVGAVGIALYGLNVWKLEIGVASDHELARRLAIGLRRYRIAVVSAWHMAESAAAQIEGNTWVGAGGNDNYLIALYRSRIIELQQVRAELESIALESAVVWGGVFEAGFDKLYAIDAKCCSCIDSYLGLLIRGRSDDRAFTTADAALEQWSEFEVHGVIDDKSIKKLFDSKSFQVESELGKRLLEGRQ